MPRPVAVVVVLAGVLALAGCAPGGLPASPDPSTAAAPTPAATASVPAPSSDPASSSAGASPAPDPLLTAPPVARLAGPGDAAGAQGSLASWTWDDAGDQAPWFVPTDAAGVAPGAALAVAFDPAAEPGSWTARWAPVAGGQPGEIAATAEGSGPVTLSAPADEGAWTLLLDARFGEGRSAAWTWAVTVGG